MPVFTQTDIPTEEEADEVIVNYQADGCTAKKEKQKNGKWKVTANCPDD